MNHGCAIRCWILAAIATTMADAMRAIGQWVCRWAQGAVTVLLLGGCAAINPYDVPQGEGARLCNSKRKVGTTTTHCAFTSAKTPDGRWEQLFPGNEAGERTVYQIPAGEIQLGVKLRYYYKGGPVESVGDALGTSVGFLFSGKARKRLDSYMDHHEILVVNHVSLGGSLAGLKVDARQGESYHIDFRIRDGKAWIWAEDRQGRRVSQVMRGVGYSHRRYWLWDDLPDP